MKQLTVVAAEGFPGGLNVRVSPDRVQPTELLRCKNARVNATVGSIEKRLGSRRMHSNAFGDQVDGLIQWNDAGTLQLVAISNNKLWHKTSDFGDFSSVTPSPTLTSDPTQMATMRANTSGAPVYLYLADGTSFWRWDGSAISRRTATNNVPANVDLFRVYHVRGFWRDSNFPNKLIWSVLGDTEDATIGTEAQGGEALVSVISGDGLTAMEVLGSSLLLATEDSIARFTGYSSRDIQLEQDTEGVSTTVGAVGPNAFRRADGFVACLSGQGPYAVNEAEALYLGDRVKPLFDALVRTQLAGSAIGWHSARREIWWAVPGPDDSGTNKTVYVYSLELGAWFGPFTTSFDITCFAEWEDAAGDSHLICGAADGYVRLLDTGTLDDVLADGSGGEEIAMDVALAPMRWSSGPAWDKTLESINLEATIPLGSELVLRWRFDSSGYWQERTVLGRGSSIQNYTVECYGQGRRLWIELVSNEAATLAVHSVIAYGYDMGRKAP